MSGDMKPFGVSGHALRKVIESETQKFEDMTSGSRALSSRAQKSQPNAVPMPWMAGFYEHLPMVVRHGEGGWFTDVDGNRYLDMNQADVASFVGHGNPVIAKVLYERANAGASFLLPTEDGIVATELLAERSGLPFWQFTGSASQSNQEILRISRVATGREKILMFEGKYHGHIDDTMVIEQNGQMVHEGLGLTSAALDNARVIPFNDLDALEKALQPRDVACLIAEPVLTNCNLVFPEGDFWKAAREMTRRTGTLMSMDEAHTAVLAYGGMTRHWSIDPDFQVIGKGLGSGFPFSAYGMTAELSELCERYLYLYHSEPVGQDVQEGLMLGGTTYACALSLAVARATLEHCVTEEAHDRLNVQGERLSSGLERLFRRYGLSWTTVSFGGRASWHLTDKAPRTVLDSGYSLDSEFTRAKRLFMATHGVWEAISVTGPALTLAHTKDDVDHYLDVSDAFLKTITEA